MITRLGYRSTLVLSSVLGGGFGGIVMFVLLPFGVLATFTTAILVTMIGALVGGTSALLAIGVLRITHLSPRSIKGGTFAAVGAFAGAAGPTSAIWLVLQLQTELPWWAVALIVGAVAALGTSVTGVVCRERLRIARAT